MWQVIYVDKNETNALLYKKIPELIDMYKVLLCVDDDTELRS